MAYSEASVTPVNTTTAQPSAIGPLAAHSVALLAAELRLATRALALAAPCAAARDCAIERSDPVNENAAAPAPAANDTPACPSARFCSSTVSGRPADSTSRLI